MVSDKPTFILIGAAGYVAPRHMAAIKAVGGELVAAVDPCDSVGVLDQYFPHCQFYHNVYDVEQKADYVVICTPNSTHALAAFWSLDSGMDAIIEKPATTNTGRLDELLSVEKNTGRRINCILNMRLHHDAGLLLAHQRQRNDYGQVEIEYHTPRGPWYAKSWKNNPEKSGGLLFNIGVHLFDLALLSFGECRHHDVEIDPMQSSGELSFDKAIVRFHLSINGRPKSRVFRVDGCEYDFTNGFEDLHVESYRRILAGRGFTLQDARPAIELCERLTSASA